ncbi:MAG: hypothetical protein AB8D52_00365 [Gammaproteobacteria bacterium]
MSHKFGISWIYEEFRISRFQFGKPVESWTSPTPVLNSADFDQAIKAASEAINMRRGGDVAITFESDVHTHSFLELPSMTDKDLEQYLERHVDQEKTFPGEASWSYCRTSKTSRGKGVLLHLMPKKILDSLIKACEKNKLDLRKVVPLTDIMSQHIPGLPSHDDGIIVLVALFDEHVEIVVADGTGESYFVRELGFHWNKEILGRLKLDIERTLLYTKQQFDSVCHIWIMGEESETAAAELKSHFDVEVDADPGSANSNFWAREVISLPNKLTSNFIPNSLQNAFARRAVVQTGVWCAAASLVVAVGSTLIIQSIKFGDSFENHNRISELELEKRNLLDQYKTLNNKHSRLDALLTESKPVPAWFLSYLGEIVPDAMILSKATFSHDGGKWIFRLEGATDPTLANSATIVESLESDLKASPWNATISQVWRKEWLEKLRQGKAGENGLISFNMEGSM